MSVRLSLPAPAKLNLFLHILGRRDDGYHELQTLFQFLDHGDELHFEARQDGQVRLHTEIAGVPHDSNLIVRAARGLQEASGSLQGVDIWLDKRLPMGGGIGGGSSDAATTLLALNHLWQLGWDEDRARLTGTGGCVFGSFPNKAEADKVSALLPDHLQRFVAKGSNVSMLHRKLETLV